ncbi:MAG: hypothetical protein LBN18_08680, partial [Dysgonamonadaceae bacterium]|nr:hypothetical protein [Dysgonamonadaceae bacterium]
MKFKVFTVFLLVNCLCLLRICPTQACGYYETEADYRAMMFRAMLPSMRTMYPFNYTMSLYEEPLSTDPDESDRYRNCAEWLAACDPSVTLDDIYQIQYNTDSRLWLKAFEKNAWKMYFPQNTFVQFLVKKQNKDLLDYMVFAKKMELTEVGGGRRFEEWENSSSYGSASYETDEEYPKEETVKPIKAQLLKTAWERLQTAPIPFLKQRYAFQVCRLRYQVDKVDSEIAGADVFSRYFGRIQPDNLMSIWAGLFEAMRISPSETERYRLLVQVFSNSNEKKFRCVQLFEDRFDPDLLTSKELSTAIVMLAVRNPGRALDSIQKAYSLDRTNPYIPFLILREINKLEDWMITPLFYGKYAGRDPFECAYRWNKKEEITTDSIDETGLKLQAENNATDRQYLAQLKAFLEEIRPKNNDEIRDFYTIALAHLSLLQENAGDARKYLAQVSSGANASIRLQKQLETIWLAIKTQDVNSQSFQKVFLQNIEDLNRVATPNYNNKQMLYTLTLSLANEYLKAGRRVYGNLLRMKADLFRYAYEEYGWYDLEYRTGDNYVTLKYFDENANLADMDQLIGLLEKQSK